MAKPEAFLSKPCCAEQCFIHTFEFLSKTEGLMKFITCFNIFVIRVGIYLCIL
jgi:hypothetical protein